MKQPKLFQEFNKDIKYLFQPVKLYIFNLQIKPGLSEIENYLTSVT
jgi:hypothetical protein